MPRILSRRLNNDEQIKIEISIEDNPTKNRSIGYILKKNEGIIKSDYWDISNIYLKIKNKKDIIYKLYHFYLDKIIIFEGHIPLDKYSDYIESNLLYDLKIISSTIDVDSPIVKHYTFI